MGFLNNGIVFSLILLSRVDANLNPTLLFWIEWAEVLGIAGFVVQLPFTMYLVRLDFELRWYIVTDRSLRIRAGIWTIREMTMTFANIQQITVEQGPLERVLGISNLRVRTAGGGGMMEGKNAHQATAEPMHVGSFNGLDNAEEIRDLILSRMRLWRDSGLGDPDDITEPSPPTPEESPARRLEKAGLDLWQEARALRECVSSRRDG